MYPLEFGSGQGAFWAFGFGVQGLGFGVKGLGFEGFWFRV